MCKNLEVATLSLATLLLACGGNPLSTPSAVEPVSADGSSPTADASLPADAACATTPKLCNKSGSKECGANEYCHFEEGTCWADDLFGKCLPRPTSCNVYDVCPGACGCDGKRYCDACAAAAVGVDVASKEICRLVPPPSSCASCGVGEYCEIVKSDVPEFNGSYTRTQCLQYRCDGPPCDCVWPCQVGTAQFSGTCATNLNGGATFTCNIGG